MSHKTISEYDAALEAATVSTQRREAHRSLPHEMTLGTVLGGLPEAVYTTDENGLITFFNQAAVSLWGVTPQIGKSEFCGSWKLFWPDGTPLPHNECPMAIALKEKRPIRGLEAIAARPDGTRVRFLAFPTPLYDRTGQLVGAVNMLVDLTDQTYADEAALRHDAIVESSDDAIIAKDLNGTIINWNRGAERLFGYTADEAIGRPVAMLIPQDRQDEEPGILTRIHRGERIEHYETIRRRKDGSLIEISLSVSPIRNRQGRIIGAAKIARDITERRQAEEQKNLLIREMDHRVKNLFALANSVLALSARSATTPGELASVVSSRLNALARSHALTIPHGLSSERPTTLHTLIETVIAPYAGGDDNCQSRAVVTGPDIAIAGTAVTNFALLLHEFATNAAKYGALSLPEGRVDIACIESGDLFTLVWNERNGPRIEQKPDSVGFGTLLAKATVGGQLGGDISRDWKPEGLSIRLSFPASRVCPL
ncbi:MAG: cheRf [Pseudomonas sp.]|nr:cheRf [Pseudomonas sp.]